MTFKNTKTILFASLIVAMILPFSGMNTAQAQPQTENPPYNISDEIDILIAEYNSLGEQRQETKRQMDATDPDSKYRRSIESSRKI